MTKPDDDYHHQQSSFSKGIEPTKRTTRTSLKVGLVPVDAFAAGILFLGVGFCCVVAERGLNFCMGDSSVELLVVGGVCIVFGLIGVIRPDIMHKMSGQDAQTRAKIDSIRKWLIPLAIVVGIAFGFFSGFTKKLPETTKQEAPHHN